MTRRRTWEIRDERKLRGSIRSSEDYQHESYHHLNLGVASGEGDMTASILYGVYPTRYAVDGADRYVAWNPLMPDSWQKGILRMTAHLQPGDTTTGDAYMRFLVSYMPVGASASNSILDTYVTVAMGGTAFKMYDGSAESSVITRLQTANDYQHMLGVRLEREATHANDTMTSSDIHVTGVLLEWLPETFKA